MDTLGGVIEIISLFAGLGGLEGGLGERQIISGLVSLFIGLVGGLSGLTTLELGGVLDCLETIGGLAALGGLETLELAWILLTSSGLLVVIKHRCALCRNTHTLKSSTGSSVTQPGHR